MPVTINHTDYAHVLSVSMCALRSMHVQMRTPRALRMPQYKTANVNQSKKSNAYEKKFENIIIFRQTHREGEEGSMQKKINYDISGRGVNNLSTYLVFVKVSNQIAENAGKLRSIYNLIRRFYWFWLLVCDCVLSVCVCHCVRSYIVIIKPIKNVDIMS